MLSFRESSSLQAVQNSFPADTVMFSPENSFAICAALTLLGLLVQVGSSVWRQDGSYFALTHYIRLWRGAK